MQPNERLNALFAPKTIDLASYKVYARATYYPDFIRVYIPHTPYDRLSSNMEARTKLKKSVIGQKQSEEDIERSLRRTKKTLRDYVLCNRFELFATFTFKKDRQDITKSKTKMANWIKNQQKRKGKFEYLIVPELHKDQESLHFHALIKKYPGKLNRAKNSKTGKRLIRNGRKVYIFPSYTLGFTDVVKIKNTSEDHSKVGSYIRKYITKDMPLFFGKNRYWVSSGLKLPETEDNPKWYLDKQAIRSHVSEYGLTLDFPASDLGESK